jgi:signal transduction histidine kinase
VAANLTPDGALRIAVSDTGIGIAAGDIARALSPFGQVDDGLNRRYEGAGLGLPLGKALVGLHGGTLELDSAVGVGTTTAVTFPARRVLAAKPSAEPALATAGAAAA